MGRSALHGPRENPPSYGTTARDPLTSENFFRPLPIDELGLARRGPPQPSPRPTPVRMGTAWRSAAAQRSPPWAAPRAPHGTCVWHVPKNPPARLPRSDASDWRTRRIGPTAKHRGSRPAATSARREHVTRGRRTPRHLHRLHPVRRAATAGYSATKPGRAIHPIQMRPPTHCGVVVDRASPPALGAWRFVARRPLHFDLHAAILILQLHRHNLPRILQLQQLLKESRHITVRLPLHIAFGALPSATHKNLRRNKV